MTLVSQLEKIESSGLIRLAQQDPELEYIFRHALVQDATYESLLKADRRTLHLAVGQTLENLYADRLDEVAATLAFHFEKAEEFDKSVGYFIRAGEAAARIYAVDEAIELFRHALEIFPASLAEENLTHLYSQYGRVLELAGRFDAVMLVYEQMSTEGIRRQNLRMELDALMAQAILRATPTPLHDFTLATELAQRALIIAQKLDDLEAQSRTYWILMLTMEFGGVLQESINYGEQSLAIARAVNNREQLAFILNDIARSYVSNGMMEKGLEANSQARLLWKELGNLPMLVDNIGSSAEFLFFRGRYRDCIAMAEEAYEISKSIHNVWGQTICLMNMSFSYMELGELDQAIQTNQKLLAFDPRETLVIVQISSRGQLATIYAELGDIDTGHQYVLSAFEAVASQPGLKAAVLAGMVEYEVARGNLDEAERLFEQATQNYDPENFMTHIPQYVETARNELLMYKGEFLAALEAVDRVMVIMDRLQIGFCRPEFMLRKARALIGLARHDQALLVLEDAAALGEKMEAHRLVWKIYSLLGDMYSKNVGFSVKAEDAWANARIHLQFLVDHAPADLRPSFLQLPEVSRLLGQIK